MVRNYIQHENSITFNDAEKFYDLIEDFIKLQIKTMFNLDYETLDIIDLIKSDNIRSLLKKACETWEINKMQAMSILRDAFDNSKREYLYELYSWDYVNIYTMATRRDIEHEIRRMLIQNTESLILSSIGIDLIQYKNYGVIIDYINGDYRSEYHGGPVMHDNEEYTNKQFEYVKEFVIDSIIKMQEKQEITKIIDLHKRPRDYFININERKWTLNDNEFIMDEKSFISIGPRKNEITYGFEIDEKLFPFFNEIKQNDILIQKNYIKGKENTYNLISEEEVIVKGVYTEIFTHNPPIWRVCITLKSKEEVSQEADKQD